ncbi:MAG: hypothetical protein AAF004_12920 [Pseudomonadota bacterium]
MSTSQQLASDIVGRLISVVDDEASCHEKICEDMVTIAMSSKDGDMAAVQRLMVGLQYFDRMQQRTRYLAAAAQTAIAHIDNPEALHGALGEHARSGPYQADAAWCRELLGKYAATEQATDEC